MIKRLTCISKILRVQRDGVHEIRYYMNSLLKNNEWIWYFLKGNPITDTGKRKQLFKMLSVVLLPMAILIGMTGNVFLITVKNFIEAKETRSALSFSWVQIWHCNLILNASNQMYLNIRIVSRYQSCSCIHSYMRDYTMTKVKFCSYKFKLLLKIVSKPSIFCRKMAYIFNCMTYRGCFCAIQSEWDKVNNSDFRTIKALAQLSTT